MKRLVSLSLALAMILSIGAVSFATEKSISPRAEMCGYENCSGTLYQNIINTREAFIKTRLCQHGWARATDSQYQTVVDYRYACGYCGRGAEGSYVSNTYWACDR